MSELEDLGDIADACALGTELHAQPIYGAHRPARSRCGSPDHMRGQNLRVYRKGNKIRTVCKLCDKLRRRSDIGSLETQG